MHVYLSQCANSMSSGMQIQDFETWMSWDTNPLYAILHESIYCQGAASQWSAHRVREKQYAGMFDAAALASTGSPVMFTGALLLENGVGIYQAHTQFQYVSSVALNLIIICFKCDFI